MSRNNARESRSRWQSGLPWLRYCSIAAAACALSACGAATAHLDTSTRNVRLAASTTTTVGSTTTGTGSTTTTLGSTTTSSAVAVPACTSSQLQFILLTEGPVQPYEFLWSMGFRNTGTTPCMLVGFPQLKVLNPAGTQIAVPVQDAQQLQNGWPVEVVANVTVQAGAVAGFYLVYIHNPANVCDVGPTTLEAIPPGQSQAIVFSTHSAFRVCSTDVVYVSPVHVGDALPAIGASS